jgi:hypothetical protein
MQQTISKTDEVVIALMDALEADAARTCPAGADQRSEGRQPLRAKCELQIFTGPEPMIESVPGMVRNLAFCGLSVVARLPRAIQTGRPVEVIVRLPDMTATHMAGVVAFCRDVEGDHYELGVAIKAAGAVAILTRNPAEAHSVYEWFADALTVVE